MEKQLGPFVIGFPGFKDLTYVRAKVDLNVFIYAGGRQANRIPPRAA